MEIVDKHNRQVLKNHLSNTAQTIATIVKSQITKNNNQKLIQEINKISNNMKIRITIILPDGKVIADSKKNPQEMENHKNRPEIISALKNQIGTSLRYSVTLKQKMLYVAVPIIKNNKIIGIVRVSNFYEEIKNLFKGLEIDILKLGFLIVLISLLVAYFFSRQITNPISELVSASQKIANGNFDVSITSKTNDEIEELATNFNIMTSQIKKYIKNLKTQKDELNRIIASTDNIIWVIDRDLKITIANQNFIAFVNKENVYRKKFWEVIFTQKIVDFINKIFKTYKEQTEEVHFDGKYFILNNSIIKSTGEIIFSLTDITKIKFVDKIKRDFISNASHELKTPLTSIKGYTEILEDELGRNYPYLSIIKRNTERLINIVKDILTLSDLEQTKQLDLENFDLKDLLINISTTIFPVINQKKLTLKTDFDSISDFCGDQFMLEQVFINLLENAIKYTERGFIKFSLHQKNNKAIIEIEDSGIGIPENKIPRIFERFYVVDKSRSRKAGGTGLGLSIVKHIVQLHKGDIEVKSKIQTGTKFIISFPINCGE